MNKLYLVITSLAAVAAAAPSAAQYQSRARMDANARFDSRIVQLQTRLRAGVDSGAITQREAYPIRQRLRMLAQLERDYRRDGYTQQERTDLRQRLRLLRQDIRVADGGAYDRYDRYADYDEDGFYGQGGPFEGDGWVVDDGSAASGGGIGNFFGNLFGIGGVRVGSRVSGNLYAVPYEYRSQFRDTNNVYFRSDGRRILEIDARTNTVLRIYTREDEVD